MHEAFVEKAREIWSDLVEQDDIVEDEVANAEEVEEQISDDEATDFIDDIESDKEEIEAEEAFGEDKDEGEEAEAEMELATDDADKQDDDMDFDGDGETDGHEEEHKDLEDKLVKVDDALADLKAEFAKLMGDDAEESEAEAEDMPAGEEEVMAGAYESAVAETTAEADAKDADDEAVEEAKADDADEAKEELEEEAKLEKIGKDGAVHPVDMPAGDDGKASPVGPGTKEVESNGGPVDFAGGKEEGGKAPAPKDMGVKGPSDEVGLKAEPKGHGAEKKGKAE
jgi:hypothetical protein